MFIDSADYINAGTLEEIKKLMLFKEMDAIFGQIEVFKENGMDYEVYEPPLNNKSRRNGLGVIMRRVYGI